MHVVIDDHSRYVYLEQHQAKDGATAAAVLERAIAHFWELRMQAPEAVMGDNAFAYVNLRAFRL